MGNVIQKLKEATLRQWLIVIFMAINTVITYIANVAFGEDRSNGRVSDENRVLIVPPGTAFSIWGFIFVFEWMFAITQLLTCPQLFSAHFFCTFGFIGAMITQCCWALAFPFSNGNQDTIRFCFVAIFGIWWFLLAQSVVANRRALAIFNGTDPTSAALVPFVGTAANDDAATAAASSQERNTTQFNGGDKTADSNTNNKKNYLASLVYYLIFVMPMSVHLGWITAATGLNLTIVVARESNTIAPQLTASIIVCCLVAVTAWTRSVAAGDLGVAGALIWALSFISKRDTGLPVRVGMPPGLNATVSVPTVVSDAITDTAVTLAVMIGVIAVVWKVVVLTGQAERLDGWFDAKSVCCSSSSTAGDKKNDDNNGGDGDNDREKPLAVTTGNNNDNNNSNSSNVNNDAGDGKVAL